MEHLLNLIVKLRVIYLQTQHNKFALCGLKNEKKKNNMNMNNINKKVLHNAKSICVLNNCTKYKLSDIFHVLKIVPLISQTKYTFIKRIYYVPTYVYLYEY